MAMGSSCRHLSALTLQKGPTPANSLGMVGFSKRWKVRKETSPLQSRELNEEARGLLAAKGLLCAPLRARPDQIKGPARIPLLVVVVVEEDENRAKT